MKRIITAVLIGMATCGAVSAQKFAIKPHAEIDLTSRIGFKSALEMSANTASNEFGIDFGYTFLNKSDNRLEVNVGLGYRYLNTSFNSEDLSYDYAAPATADVDGNAYTRFCEVSNLCQKINSGYVTLPVYLQYAYRCTDWMEAHALAGVKLGFNTGASTKTTSGEVYSYGVFHEYDDLVIDAPYLDDFGTVLLTGYPTGKASVNSVMTSLMVGAGLDFRIYGPLWVDLGLKYQIGFNDMFGKSLSISQTNGYTAETSPITYTVADGTKVKALSDYVNQSRFNPFSLHVGVNLRF